jgi:hypothetical protein
MCRAVNNLIFSTSCGALWITGFTKIRVKGCGKIRGKKADFGFMDLDI